MSTSTAKKVWFDDYTMWVDLDDGRTLGIPLAWFPRLLDATPSQREEVRIGYGGEGLHWEEIDEDISVAGLIAGRGDMTRRPATAAPRGHRPAGRAEAKTAKRNPAPQAARPEGRGFDVHPPGLEPGTH